MKKVLILVLAIITGSLTVSAQTDTKQSKKVIASYYHKKFNGRKTATGDTYWDHLKTAASNVYKLGTQLLITNTRTGKSVKVVVNDRMAPHIKGRVDLSRSAFEKIANVHRGIVPVKVEVLEGKSSSEML
ncbi:MAG: septal ring lytic transglycosylase RlpA family protein [Niabella sp.]